MAQIIFISIFLCLYWGMQAFSFRILFSLLDLEHGRFLYAAFLIMPLCFMAATIFKRQSHSVFIKVFYYVNALWMGVVFILFCLVLITAVSRFFIGRVHPWTGWVIVFLTAFLTLYSIVNAQLIRVRTLTIISKSIPRDFRIVHISDLHLGAVRGSRYMEKVVRITNELDPDCVCLTGDILDTPADPGLVEPLNSFTAPVFFTTGNHEYYAGLDAVMEQLKKMKLRVLRNESVDFQGIQIIGIDDSENPDKPAAVLAGMKINPDRFVLLMYHRPVLLEQVAEQGIDLVLSGHTHNGQVFPFNILVRWFYPYITGVYRQGATVMSVSQGASTWGPPMRLGSGSEIVCIDIAKE